MKRSFGFVLPILFLVTLFSCQKELSFESHQPTSPGSGGTAVFTLSGSGGNCLNSNVSGSYAKGTALGSSNKVDIEVNVGTIGTWAINSSSVTGFYFAGSGTFSSTGVQTISLAGSGTPSAEGDQTFTLTAGGVSCTFVVSVAAAGTGGGGGIPSSGEYFPLTANSWWSYDDGTGSSDSIKIINSATAVLGGKTYQIFVTWDGSSASDSSYYRKDNATGFYYQYISTADLAANGFPITFSQPGLEVLFLKNSLTTGATWNSDFTGTVSGFPATLRFKFTCVNANTTITVNGKDFKNAYQIRTVPQVGTGGTFTDADVPVDSYYVPGIGLIRITDQTDFQDIRYWSVK